MQASKAAVEVNKLKQSAATDQLASLHKKASAAKAAGAAVDKALQAQLKPLDDAKALVRKNELAKARVSLEAAVKKAAAVSHQLQGFKDALQKAKVPLLR